VGLGARQWACHWSSVCACCQVHNTPGKQRRCQLTLVGLVADLARERALLVDPLLDALLVRVALRAGAAARRLQAGQAILLQADPVRTGCGGDRGEGVRCAAAARGCAAAPHTLAECWQVQTSEPHANPMHAAHLHWPSSWLLARAGGGAAAGDGGCCSSSVGLFAAAAALLAAAGSSGWRSLFTSASSCPSGAAAAGGGMPACLGLVGSRNSAGVGCAEQQQQRRVVNRDAHAPCGRSPGADALTSTRGTIGTTPASPQGLWPF
jgi:hypothetical protein